MSFLSPLSADCTFLLSAYLVCMTQHGTVSTFCWDPLIDHLLTNEHSLFIVKINMVWEWALHRHFHKEAGIANSLHVLCDLVRFYGDAKKAANFAETFDSPIFDVEQRKLDPKGE